MQKTHQKWHKLILNLFEKKEGKEMKKIISVYIIFAFLLMSFVGCGKLKNIVGLSQPEAPIPPKVDSQLDTSASPEVNSQLDTSASSEVNSQLDTSASPEVNSQPDTSASSEVNSQPDTSASSEVDSQLDTSASSEVDSQLDTSASPKANKQFEASPTQLQWLRVFSPKASNQPKSRNGKAIDVAAVVLVGVVFTASAIYHTPGLFNRDVRVPDRPYFTIDPVLNDASYLPGLTDILVSVIIKTLMPPVFNNPPNSIEVRGSIKRTAGGV